MGSLRLVSLSTPTLSTDSKVISGIGHREEAVREG